MPDNARPTTGTARDIIVIGASAGGVDALRLIAQELPADFPATVFVVLHVSRDTPSLLGPLLDRLSRLRVTTAEDGDPIEPGRMYVAPRDRHMTLRDGRVHVAFGPPQDRYRPSIDVLFRSAAREYGPRVVGVVLTGFLSDGTAGLSAIKKQGGLAVVEDPRSAMFRGMPENALKTVDVDHCVPLAEIPDLLVRVTEGSNSTPEPMRSDLLQFETDADLGITGDLEKVADPSSFICPDCGGGLWEMRSGDPQRFRCRVGHGYSAERLAEMQAPLVERALWDAMRTLEDRAALSRRLADSWRDRRAPSVVDHFTRIAEQSSAHAAIIQSILRTPVPPERNAPERKP